MNWEKTFKSQDYGRPIYKHINLPVYITDEFDFYRCVEFNSSFYGKTASTLFNGNLRICSGRYSKLFPNQKLSYWADSPATARAEIKKHGAGNNILTFWAYDDATSTFPTFPNQEPLIIIDGRKCGVQELIDKADSGIPLSKDEQRDMKELLAQEPDCLVYDSHARQSGEKLLIVWHLIPTQEQAEKTLFSLKKDFANWHFVNYGFGFAGAKVAAIAKLFVLILVIIRLILNHMGSILCQKLR